MELKVSMARCYSETSNTVNRTLQDLEINFYFLFIYLTLAKDSICWSHCNLLMYSCSLVSVCFSVFSRYGIHSVPSILVVNQTSRVRYYGRKDLASMVEFYKKTTGKFLIKGDRYRNSMSTWIPLIWLTFSFLLPMIILERTTTISFFFPWHGMT